MYIYIYIYPETISEFGLANSNFTNVLFSVCWTNDKYLIHHILLLTFRRNMTYLFIWLHS